MNPLDVQIGGSHYKSLPIQPIEYCFRNKLNVCQSKVVKYITRYKDKGGIEDLRKVIHMTELLIKLEYGEEESNADVEQSEFDRELPDDEEHNEGCLGGGVTVLPDGFKLSDYTPEAPWVCTCGCSGRPELGGTDKEYLPSSQR